MFAVFGRVQDGPDLFVGVECLRRKPDAPGPRSANVMLRGYNVISANVPGNNVRLEGIEPTVRA